MIDKPRAIDIELAVADWLDTRRNLIVPNVSYGLNLHECDLLVLSKSGYATEIEIKVSHSDLKADAKKWHEHRSKRIKFLYFAMPAEMKAYIDDVPAKAGVILVSLKQYGSGYCEIVRRPLANALAVKFSMDDQFQMARLGTLRMWKLKHELRQSKPEKALDFSI